MFDVAFHSMFITFTFQNNPSLFTLIRTFSRIKVEGFLLLLQLAKDHRARIKTQVFICLKASAVFFILSYLNNFFLYGSLNGTLGVLKERE